MTYYIYELSICQFPCALLPQTARFGDRSVDLDDHTALRRFTPHHSTGARLVAQSKVNKLMNQRMTSTGIGARRTSVRLRKGRAMVFVSGEVNSNVLLVRTVVAEERDHEVVAEG